MRLLIGLAALLASTLACGQAGSSPYLLQVDRTPYLLKAPYRAAESASAGSSRSAALPAMPAHASSPALIAAGQAIESRARQYEQRIRELEQERDGWQRRAQMLEGERQGLLRGLSLPLPPPYLGR